MGDSTKDAPLTSIKECIKLCCRVHSRLHYVEQVDDLIVTRILSHLSED